MFVLLTILKMGGQTLRWHGVFFGTVTYELWLSTLAASIFCGIFTQGCAITMFWFVLTSRWKTLWTLPHLQRPLPVVLLASKKNQCHFFSFHCWVFPYDAKSALSIAATNCSAEPVLNICVTVAGSQRTFAQAGKRPKRIAVFYTVSCCGLFCCKFKWATIRLDDK